MDRTIPNHPTLLVALGGNALASEDDDGTVGAQYLRARAALAEVADIVAEGSRVVLTHGNGPVVGNIVLRNESARESVPPTPLFISDADSEGGIGLMMQQVFGNLLVERGCGRSVATVVTQVVVDAKDPAFASPTKPIGPPMDERTALERATTLGWSVARDARGRWRRVVASPVPLEVVEIDAIRTLLDAGIVPIAAGGGGVPVTDNGGDLAGIDAVIDKDLASALLAERLGADILVIVMAADGYYERWGTPDAELVTTLSAERAEAIVADDSTGTGDIAPKLAAAARFARRTGRPAVLCAAGHVAAALRGEAGTRVEKCAEPD